MAPLDLLRHGLRVVPPLVLSVVLGLLTSVLVSRLGPFVRGRLDRVGPYVRKYWATTAGTAFAVLFVLSTVLGLRIGRVLVNGVLAAITFGSYREFNVLKRLNRRQIQVLSAVWVERMTLPDGGTLDGRATDGETTATGTRAPMGGAIVGALAGGLLGSSFGLEGAVFGAIVGAAVGDELDRVQQPRSGED